MMTNKKAAVWLICFLAVLLLPMPIYAAVSPYLDSETTENRELAAMPELDTGDGAALLESLKDFPDAFTSYYEDHVPFRSELIEANNVAIVELFKESPSDSVILGKENWLFYTEEGSIEDYKGTNLYTEEELAQIVDNAVTTKAYLEERGIEYVVMIPSNKEDIYSEYLPDYIRKTGELTRARQVVDALSEAGVRVVYPREELLAYKDAYDLYWHYDTHWNYLGGYIGGKALLAELGIEVPEVEELLITPFENSGYDLAGMMNLRSYFEEHMPPDTNYYIYGYDTHNLVTIKAEDASQLIYSSDAPDTRRLFLVRDSFAGAMATLLASNFSYTYMPHWSTGFEVSQIEEQDPDIFVYEVVERRLDVLLTFRLE